MTSFPEKQDIAQAELDHVIGTSRLPTMDDRASLPYIDAMIKEILRWNVIVPLSVPRRTVEDDVYKGNHRRCQWVVYPNVLNFKVTLSQLAPSCCLMSGMQLCRLHHLYCPSDSNIYRSMAFDSSDRAKDFIPERFLAPEGPQDPHVYNFGFGRRCVLSVSSASEIS